MDSLTAAAPPIAADHIVDLDIFNLPGADSDYYGAWKALASRDGPAMLWTTANGGHWIATDGALVRSLWDDTERLSSEVLAVTPGLGAAMRLIPLQQDGAEHKAFRSAVMKGFSASYITALQPKVAALARELAEGVLPRGGCEFMSEFAEILPVHIFLSLIDVPVEDRVILRPLGAQLTRPDGTMTVEGLRDAVDAYLLPYIRERLERPGDDLLSRILAGGVDGRAWTLDEALRMSRNIMFAGLDTVAATIGMAAMHLACQPEDQRLLRAEPDLLPAAADELMRRYPTAAVSRNALCDFDVGGVTVRRGDVVYLSSALHNLDPACFDEPDVVRFDRALNPMRHTTLGVGAHRCVGAGLARMEMILFLREWLAVIPEFRLDPASAVQMKGGNVGTCTHLPLCW